MSVPYKILLLGGTTEARELTEILTNCRETETVVSLAGRTTFPASFKVPVRIGGFGGVDGLVRYLRENHIDLMINATHPYAAQMAANAVEATRRVGVPLISFQRPPWEPAEGDCWTIADKVSDAIAILGRRKARNVFLPLGRKELLPFETAPRHCYLIRAIEAFEPPLNLPKAAYIQARPPFSKASELALMKKHRIDIMVVKNSGGSASYAKIVAARELGIEVVMLRRPQLPEVPACRTVAEVMASLTHELNDLRTKRVA